jgi:effector-binding domain-containing protein
MDMSSDVRIEQAASRPIAVVRRLASAQQLARVIPDACGTVWNMVRAQKLVGAGRHVALYWDDKINLEVGVELDGLFAGHGDVVSSATPSGTVATVVHLGPYSGLHSAHATIRRWCVQHGHTLAGPNWEIYGHWVDEWNSNPSVIRTDVFYLLKPAR